MSNDATPIGREGLRHFGRISASVSHEIKNVLAVINESAGLMDDLALMAERGMPVPPDKIHHVAGTILAQVRRGDAIIKNFNTFAHTIDEDAREVNLADVVELASALSRRFAANNNVTLTLGDKTAAAIRTAPFSLMHLLQLCIDQGLAAARSGDVLTLALGPSGDGFELTIAGMGPEAAPPRLGDRSGAGPRPGSGHRPGFRLRSPACPPPQEMPPGPGIDANPMKTIHEENQHE